MNKLFIFTLFVFLLPISANAQEQASDDDNTVLYVTDQLRLSLYQQADAQSKAILYLSSGDKLIILEVAGPYAKVIAPSGKRGWVKRGFLVSEPTSNLLLADMTETNELLKRELEKLNNSKVVLDQYERDMDSMSEKITNLERQKLSAESTINEMIQATKEKQRKENSRPALASLKKIVMTYWQYLALSIVVIILVGFLLGKTTTERAIKRKFHGIKVW